jgi:dTDP-4-dehydrorhamnose 3,5-epimerase
MGEKRRQLRMSSSNYGLPGVQTYDAKIFIDERGFFSEVLRKDWEELLGSEWIVQANLSQSYPGVVRAWHRHTRGQVDYFLVIKGSMKICAYDDAESSSTRGGFAEVIAGENKPQIVKIPGRYWHGTKTVSPEASLTVYFVTKLYDLKNPDEDRRPWNDPKVIPTAINGRTNDPRVGKPWDWFFAIHK